MSLVKFILLLLFALLLVATGIAVVSSIKIDAANKQIIEELWHKTGDETVITYQPEQLKGLPPPVQRYLQKVLPVGMPRAQHILLEQHGIFNTGNVSPQWMPLKATSHIATMPPGMIWEARLSLLPPLNIRVIDHYLHGRGALSGTILGVIPMIDAPPSPELDQGELITWLAEAVWYPTALLPQKGLTWDPIDQHSARATIDDGYNSVSLVFRFNNLDEVTSVHTDARARLVKGSYQMTPWSCHFRKYVKMGGALVPQEGEVVWHLPHRDLPYMRVRIDSLEINPER